MRGWIKVGSRRHRLHVPLHKFSSAEMVTEAPMSSPSALSETAVSSGISAADTSTSNLEYLNFASMPSSDAGCALEMSPSSKERSKTSIF